MVLVPVGDVLLIADVFDGFVPNIPYYQYHIVITTAVVGVIISVFGLYDDSNVIICFSRTEYHRA